MNPVILLPLLQALMSSAAQINAPAAQSDPAVKPAAPAVDWSGIAAVVAAAAQQPSAPPMEMKLPRSAAVIAAVVVIGFFAVLAAIAGILVFDQRQIGAGAIAALVALSIGFGVLCSKFGTIIDFLFGSSWGSRQKDAQRQTSGSGSVIPVPVPSAPQPSPPAPSLPAPGGTEEQPPPSAPVAPTTAPTGSVDGIGRSTSQGTAWILSDVAPDGRPASVRYCNPGAQYPSERAAVFGQIGYGMIGGGHKIARFPHPVNGAAANFDLLSRSYTGMTVAAAGDKWTGGNGHGIPGYDDNIVLTKDMVADPAQAIPIMRAIAEREAGRLYTVSDIQWSQAHAMFLAGSADAWLDGKAATEAQPQPQAKRATGADIVALARPHVGEKYDHVLVPKDNPGWKGPWDCSEFASWLVYQAGKILYGCLDDGSPPAKAKAYTGAWQTDARNKGKMISVAEAAATPGAFILRYPPAPGNMGHIVVSDGDGGTVEAAGTATGVVAGKVSGRRWDTGVLVPGIDYASGAVQAVQPPAMLYAVGQPNMDAGKVTDIQNALAAKGFAPGAVDGEYGINTAMAVAEFQSYSGLIQDGEVGPNTAEALGIAL